MGQTSFRSTSSKQLMAPSQSMPRVTQTQKDENGPDDHNEKKTKRVWIRGCQSGRGPFRCQMKSKVTTPVSCWSITCPSCPCISQVTSSLLARVIKGVRDAREWPKTMNPHVFHVFSPLFFIITKTHQQTTWTNVSLFLYNLLAFVLRQLPKTPETHGGHIVTDWPALIQRKILLLTSFDLISRTIRTQKCCYI